MDIETTLNANHNYDAPIVWVIPMAFEDVLCGSPVPGGNEDVGYDDWDE